MSLLGYVLCCFYLSSQKEEDGERRKKQRTFQSGYTELPHYTALDAVGWVCHFTILMTLQIQ